MTYLVKRNKIYYFRIVVPIDLRIYFLRNEILKSLKTQYFDSARELVRQIFKSTPPFLELDGSDAKGLIGTDGE